MHLVTYLALLDSAERALGGSYLVVADGHQADADVHYACRGFAGRCDAHRERLAPVRTGYDRGGHEEPDRLHPEGLAAVRGGPLGLLRDLQDLYQLANLVDITWALVGQAAAGARDRTLLELTATCGQDTTSQLAWLRMRMKAEAPQSLLAAP